MFLIELPRVSRNQPAALFAIGGQRVASFMPESEVLTVDLASQPDGIYLLQLASETVALVKL